jgi:hypothetical protein
MWGVEDGWAALRLYSSTPPQPGSLIDQNRMHPDDAGVGWLGLPAMGISATRYTNGQIVPGVLSNYADFSRMRASNRFASNVLPDPLFKDGFEALPPFTQND